MLVYGALLTLPVDKCDFYLFLSMLHERACGVRGQFHSGSRARGFCSPPLGYTPLHYACGRGYRGIAELLLFHGADATAEVCRGDLLV